MKQTEIQKSINEANDTPCMKCLKKAQADLITCYIAAGDDDAKKKACDKALAAAIKLCPCP